LTFIHAHDVKVAAVPSGRVHRCTRN
jgi:hypothetical protein